MLYFFYKLFLFVHVFANGQICDRSKDLNVYKNKFVKVLNLQKSAYEQMGKIKDGIPEYIDFAPIKRDGYDVWYAASVVPYPADFVMGLYTNADQHAGSSGLGAFILESRMQTQSDVSPYQVLYKQDAQWPLSDSTYTVEVDVKAIGLSQYLLDSRLLSHGDQTVAPTVADAYLKVVKIDPNDYTPEMQEYAKHNYSEFSLVVACNYMKPKPSKVMSALIDQYNSEVENRFKASARNFGQMLKVKADQGEMPRFKTRLAKLLKRKH